jgi:carbamoyltransferase
MITWGIVGNSHDASLAVFKDDQLKFAALSKDFSGVDHDPDLNFTLISVARVNYGGGPDRVVWYERPFLKTLRQWRAGQGWLWKENNIKKYLARYGIHCPIEYSLHHHSHAAYGYYTSGFDNASILCIDSIGEFQTLTVWQGVGDDLHCVHKQRYPDSLGLFYSAMTQRCGLTAQRDEGMMTDLARDKKDNEVIRLMIKDLLWFDESFGYPTFKFKVNLHKGCDWWRPEIKDVGKIAYATQWIFEQIVERLSNSMLEQMPSKNLIVVGGCALNGKAVRRISYKWKNVWVPPNPGDPGSCIGAVLASTKKHIDFNKNLWYNSSI